MKKLFIYSFPLLLLFSILPSSNLFSQETQSGCEQQIFLNPEIIKTFSLEKNEYRVCSGQAYQGVALVIDELILPDLKHLVVSTEINNPNAQKINILEGDSKTTIKSKIRCVTINLPDSQNWVIKAHTTCFDIPKENLKLETELSPKRRIH